MGSTYKWYKDNGYSEKKAKDAQAKADAKNKSSSSSSSSNGRKTVYSGNNKSDHKANNSNSKYNRSKNNSSNTKKSSNSSNKSMGNDYYKTWTPEMQQRQDELSRENDLRKSNKASGKGYAYVDEYGFEHVTSSLETAKKYSGDGKVYDYKGDYDGGYAKDKNGNRARIGLEGSREYGNNVKKGKTSTIMSDAYRKVIEDMEKRERERDAYIKGETGKVKSDTPTEFTTSNSPDAKPTKELTAEQKRERAYIESQKDKYGSVDEYISNQQERWKQAVIDQDRDLQAKLISDSERIGYSLDYSGSSTKDNTTVETQEVIDPMSIGEQRTVADAFYDKSQEALIRQYEESKRLIEDRLQRGKSNLEGSKDSVHGQFDDANKAIDENTYKNMESAKANGAMRGLMSSQQQAGMEQNVRNNANSLKADAVSDRDAMLNDIDRRIADLIYEADSAILGKQNEFASKELEIMYQAEQMKLEEQARIEDRNARFQHDYNMLDATLSADILKMDLGHEKNVEMANLSNRFSYEMKLLDYDQKVALSNLSHSQQIEIMGIDHNNRVSILGMQAANQRAMFNMEANLKREFFAMEEASKEKFFNMNEVSKQRWFTMENEAKEGFMKLDHDYQMAVMNQNRDWAVEDWEKETALALQAQTADFMADYISNNPDFQMYPEFEKGFWNASSNEDKIVLIEDLMRTQGLTDSQIKVTMAPIYGKFLESSKLRTLFNQNDKYSEGYYDYVQRK